MKWLWFRWLMKCFSHLIQISKSNILIKRTRDSGGLRYCYGRHPQNICSLLKVTRTDRAGNCLASLILTSWNVEIKIAVLTEWPISTSPLGNVHLCISWKGNQNSCFLQCISNDRSSLFHVQLCPWGTSENISFHKLHSSALIVRKSATSVWITDSSGTAPVGVAITQNSPSVQKPLKQCITSVRRNISETFQRNSFHSFE